MESPQLLVGRAALEKGACKGGRLQGLLTEWLRDDTSEMCVWDVALCLAHKRLASY